MVGVPGRSKGCITCRTRRKGCDLQRPTCGQCTKAGLTCAGYSTPPTFVISTPTSRQAGYRVTTPNTRSSGLWDCIARNQVFSDITNPRLLTRPEEERRCIDLFWEAYFPSGKPIPSDSARSYTCTWTEVARNLYRDDDALRYALWANCLLLTGKRHGVEWILRESSRVYGKALTLLRGALERSSGTNTRVHVATVKLLSMFEALSQRRENTVKDPQSRDWQRHNFGELALIISGTPAAHMTGEAHYVFADERVEMALSALLERRRLPLDGPEWKTLPWQVIPKDLKDVLVDVLIDMPGLVEEFDRMRLCYDLEIREVLQARLLAKCWEHDCRLLEWLRLLQPFANHDSQQSKPKDLVIHVAQVHGMSLFWVTGLVLYSTLRMLSKPETILPSRTDPILHAHHLVDAITILLHADSGLYGVQSAMLIIEVGLEALKKSWENGLERLGSP
ncbi:Sterigmatocystin biosynthesis regulatory protein [Echria macrotheca]|uniref:Sterigmatocystin biosynthesis regulatory protein n=1 Tax=Echria macrotheca TaxID=438768 RepID=A0AAJ0B5C8_9PEZI|nr:Sterigmatocystin biosynthesis regulatory protein [Echria macrotheca]